MSSEPYLMADQIAQCTIRIKSDLKDGRNSTGTGFFFNLPTQLGNVPTIITNKHVVTDSIRGHLRFNLADPNWEKKPGETRDIIVEDFEKLWIMHPNVDLALLPVQQLHAQYDSPERILYRRSFSTAHIPTNVEKEQLLAIEDVIMAGYPLGIWDETNNLPIIRKGITATAPYRDYNGKGEFVIDMAIFPGSSGSPVCLYNAGSYETKDGLRSGSRLKLLGILYSTAMFNAKGDIVVENAPTAAQLRSSAAVPCNLGFVIKSSSILDFIPIIEKLYGKPEQIAVK